MIYVLKFLENSDATCSCDVRLFSTKDDADKTMKTGYEKSLAALGGRFGECEEESESSENQRWAQLHEEGAYIQDGIDSFSWEIISDAEFLSNKAIENQKEKIAELAETYTKLANNECDQTSYNAANLHGFAQGLQIALGILSGRKVQ